jgi:hypothetical protein
MKIEFVDKTINVTAKRGSGKSVLTKYFIKSMGKLFHKVFVVCPTEQINRFYSDLVEADNIFETYSEDWTETLIKTLTKINSGKVGKDQKKVLLILDDCCSDTHFHTSNSLKKLYTRGRHLGLSVIMISQHLTHIPPVCRNNADYVIVSQLNRASLGLLADEYCSAGISKEEFIKLYGNATKDFHFFVINQNATKSGDIDEIYGCIGVPKDFVKKIL